VFIREKKILKYIYIYTSVCTYIQQTRSNALSSLSLALAPRIFYRSDGRRRRPLSPLLINSLSSFLLSFRISLGYSNPTCFHVASFLLSRVSFWGERRFCSIQFSRATRTHTHTKLKKNAIHDRPKSLRVRALPDENDETGEKEKRFESLFSCC